MLALIIQYWRCSVLVSLIFILFSISYVAILTTCGLAWFNAVRLHGQRDRNCPKLRQCPDMNAERSDRVDLWAPMTIP